MTAPTKRTRGRPRKLTAVSIPTHSTLGVRLTAEQRAVLQAAAGPLDLSTWLREVGLAKVGRSDLGAEAQSARIRAALSPTGVDPVTGIAMDRAEQVRRETGRMPDDVRHEGGTQ